MDRAICLGDVATEEGRILLGNRCFNSGALAEGSAPAKVNLAVAVNYSIDGQIYAKDITADLFVHTDTTLQAAATTKWYLLSLDSGGNALITAGPANLTANVTAITNKSALPKIAATQCAVGAIKVVTVGSTFTPGSTSHNGITTYYNMSCVPIAGVPA